MGLETKDPAEIQSLQFSFADAIGSATISSAALTNTVEQGADGSASAMLLNTPTISGSTVTQLYQNGVSGNIYKVRCLATLNDGRKILRTKKVKVFSQ